MSLPGNGNQAGASTSLVMTRPASAWAQWGTSLAGGIMISRDGKIPPTIQVECPNCGLVTSIALQHSDGATIDYEGTCTGKFRSPVGLCKTLLLLTVTIPKEEDDP